MDGLYSKHGEINPLNAKLNPFCHLLALLGAHHILHVSRIRVKDALGILVGNINPYRTNVENRVSS